ncbi:MAG: hypothetical protein AAGA58_09340 [Verrucomicrobiota bacterium]
MNSTAREARKIMQGAFQLPVREPFIYARRTHPIKTTKDAKGREKEIV